MQRIQLPRPLGVLATGLMACALCLGTTGLEIAHAQTIGVGSNGVFVTTLATNLNLPTTQVQTAVDETVLQIQAQEWDNGLGAYGAQCGYGYGAWGDQHGYDHSTHGDQHGYGAYGDQCGYGYSAWGHQYGNGYGAWGDQHGYDHNAYGSLYGYGLGSYSGLYGYGEGNIVNSPLFTELLAVNLGVPAATVETAIQTTVATIDPNGVGGNYLIVE